MLKTNATGISLDTGGESKFNQTATMINVDQYQTLKNSGLNTTKNKITGSELLKNRYTATCRFVWNPQPRTGDFIAKF